MIKENGETRRRWRLALGPAVALVFCAIPTPTELQPEAMRLAGITTWMALWWVTEAAPVAVTALLPLALFPLLGIADPKTTASAYGHDLIWLFFGGFQLAFAVERWGLHRRLALGIVRRVGARPDRLVLGFILASGLGSMWLVNTSITLMLLPVASAVAGAIEDAPDDSGRGGPRAGPIGAALLLGVAYASSIGGTGTLVGTAPNGILVGVAAEMGLAIGFGNWMGYATPLALLLLVGLWLYLTRLAFPVPRRPLPDGHPAVAALSARPAPWTRPERHVAIGFALAIVGWLGHRTFSEKLGLPPISDATVAVGAALLLYLWPVAGGRVPPNPLPGERGPRASLLTWADGVATPWAILLLFGGGFALAAGFESTGLSAWLGHRLAATISGLPLPMIVLSVVLLVTFLTEVTSNTATATVLLPVVGALARGLDVEPILLMAPATLAASCAFMLPVATPPNAIVFASGRFRLADMTRAGLWINLGTAAAITAWTVWYGAWWFAE